MKISVIGDIMIDEYVHVTIDRVSAEAPIPVMKNVGSTHSPGGAANVWANVNSISKEEAKLLGIVGTDCPIMFPSPVIFSRRRFTTTKTRFIDTTFARQVARADRERIAELSKAEETFAMDEFRRVMHDSDVIIVSDYEKGFCTTNLMSLVTSARDSIVIVASKRQDLSRFRSADLFVMNKDEWNRARSLKSNEFIIRNSRIIVTLGASGAMLVNRNGFGSVEMFPTSAVDVADVTGAGDTFAAALGVSLGRLSSFEEAIHFANRASRIAVSKRGTSAVSFEEL